jgi:hypothetical protein
MCGGLVERYPAHEPCLMYENAKHIQIPKWIHAGPCVVRVEVEALLLPHCPDEPSLAPATMRWLEQLQALADGDNGTSYRARR